MPRKDGSPSRSGPSGPTIPVDQRTRRPVNLTLSVETVAWLAAESERTEESRSALVDTLVLTARPEAYLPPALLEDVIEAARERGQTVQAALTDAVECWLAGLERDRVEVVATPAGTAVRWRGGAR